MVAPPQRAPARYFLCRAAIRASAAYYADCRFTDADAAACRHIKHTSQKHVPLPPLSPFFAAMLPVDTLIACRLTFFLARRAWRAIETMPHHAAV